jgi:hypothetical protein
VARGRLLIAGTTAALCAAVVVVAAGAQRPERALLLPDLVQEAPRDLQLTRSDGRLHLGFASAVRNAGSGPLTIRASRPSRRRVAMSAVQLVRREDGALLRRPGAGIVQYTRSPDHAHWHLLRFDRYTLRRPGARRSIVTDRKTGFCLGDRYDAIAGRLEPAEPAQPPYRTTCGLRRPSLLQLTEGISVGYGDDYDAYLEGQYLDVTGLPAGEYELVHRVNADGRLLEERYDNNAACLRVRLPSLRTRRCAGS